MKDYEKAVESFNNALEQNPYGYAAHLNMALALYHLGELEYYTEARKHLDEVVRLRSHIPSQIATKIELKTLYLKGLCLYGEFEIASGGRKQQKGVRAHQALKRFTNRVSSEDEIFADQREDAEAKIDAIEQQIY